MKILSLFDGMACGALAMQAAGIEIDKYIAYEVDKYAIQTAQHNFPFIEERGDVFKADFTEYVGFDYLIGGSPCTYWSIAQTKNRETVASGMGWELFSQYVRALHEAKPRFFLYENNKSMSAAIRASITETFGFEPILINSALVSAQNRQRLYWCGIRQADGTYKKADIQQPADRGILLKDILETNAVTWQEKAYIYTTRCQGAIIENTLEKHQHTMVAEPVQPLTEKEMDYMIRDHQDQRWSFCNKPGQEDKSKCLVANVHKGVPYNILAEPICVNSKSGRAGVEGLQPSLQDRIYDTAGKMPAVTTSFNPQIAEPVQPYINEIELVNYKVRKDSEIVITDRNMRCAKNDLKHSSATESVVRLPNAKSNALITAHGVKVFEKIAEPLNAENMKIREATKAAPIYEVKDGYITVKGNKYPIKLVDGFYIIRKLTVRECMRLQTVPEWYEWPVSKSQAYKMLGNGWTVEVIAHLLRGLK